MMAEESKDPATVAQWLADPKFLLERRIHSLAVTVSAIVSDPPPIDDLEILISELIFRTETEILPILAPICRWTNEVELEPNGSKTLICAIERVGRHHHYAVLLDGKTLKRPYRLQTWEHLADG